MFKHLNISTFKYRRDQGVSSLPTMILLGGIIIEIAIAIAFLTFYFNSINFGARLAAEALEVARAGVDDAIIRVVRDKNYSHPSPGYNIEVGVGRTADVVVCRDFRTVNAFCDTGNPGETEITSISKVLNRQKSVRAVLSVDPNTGQVSIVSIGEAEL